jgi:ABC-type transporter Mla subunit MlaD
MLLAQFLRKLRQVTGRDNPRGREAHQVLRIEIVDMEKLIQQLSTPLKVEVAGMGELIQAVNRLGENVMALVDELKTLNDGLNNATNAVATQLDKMKTEIAGLLANPNSITNDDKVAFEAAMQTQINRLNSLGADPDNPIPPVPVDNPVSPAANPVSPTVSTPQRAQGKTHL